MSLLLSHLETQIMNKTVEFKFYALWWDFRLLNYFGLNGGYKRGVTQSNGCVTPKSTHR